MKRARQVEAELLAQVAAGQHRGSRTKTVAELIERWLEWRLSVRPISPTTVAASRGFINRSILPSLGRLQVGQPDAATLDTFSARLLCMVAAEDPELGLFLRLAVVLGAAGASCAHCAGRRSTWTRAKS